MGGVPPGDGMGGVGHGKKVPEKISKKKIGPNRLINSICACFRKSVFFLNRKKIEKKIFRPTGGCSPPGGAAGGVVPQGGLQGGVGPLYLGERP